MQHRSFLSGAGKRRLQLQHASGISGNDGVGVQWSDELRLAIAKRSCSIRLDKVVDSGGATADGRLRNLSKVQPRDVRKQGARLGAHALCVLQVARIVVGHA